MSRWDNLKKVMEWFYSEEGRFVWVKQGSHNWSRVASPSWYKDATYVQDDKHSIARRHLADGEAIGYINPEGSWVQVDNPTWIRNKYSVRPQHLKQVLKNVCMPTSDDNIKGLEALGFSITKDLHPGSYFTDDNQELYFTTRNLSDLMDDGKTLVRYTAKGFKIIKATEHVATEVNKLAVPFTMILQAQGKSMGEDELILDNGQALALEKQRFDSDKSYLVTIYEIGAPVDTATLNSCGSQARDTDDQV